MQRRFLRIFGPDEEVCPPPPKPPKAEDSHGGPAQTRRGTQICFRCGRLLYQNNKSHMCFLCQRKFGLPTLRRRNKPLQQWHLENCHDPNCSDPAHLADRIPVRPRRPRRPRRPSWLRSNEPASRAGGPISHSVLLDRWMSEYLGSLASAKSAELGCRVAKTDLIRQAIQEFFRNHPASEFFEDAAPE